MAAGEEADQETLDQVVLPDDDPPDLGLDLLEGERFALDISVEGGDIQFHSTVRKRASGVPRSVRSGSLWSQVRLTPPARPARRIVSQAPPIWHRDTVLRVRPPLLKKSLGQHHLTDGSICRPLVRFLRARGSEGPGDRTGRRRADRRASGGRRPRARLGAGSGVGRRPAPPPRRRRLFAGRRRRPGDRLARLPPGPWWPGISPTTWPPRSSRGSCRTTPDRPRRRLPVRKRSSTASSPARATRPTARSASSCKPRPTPRSSAASAWQLPAAAEGRQRLRRLHPAPTTRARRPSCPPSSHSFASPSASAGRRCGTLWRPGWGREKTEAVLAAAGCWRTAGEGAGRGAGDGGVSADLGGGTSVPSREGGGFLPLGGRRLGKGGG